MREKYEEMAKEFGSSRAWLSQFVAIPTFFELNQALAAPHAVNVYTLCSLYFLPLEPKASAYLEAHRTVYQAVVAGSSSEKPLPFVQAQSSSGCEAALDGYKKAADALQEPALPVVYSGETA